MTWRGQGWIEQYNRKGVSPVYLVKVICLEINFYPFRLFNQTFYLISFHLILWIWLASLKNWQEKFTVMWAFPTHQKQLLWMAEHNLILIMRIMKKIEQEIVGALIHHNNIFTVWSVEFKYQFSQRLRKSKKWRFLMHLGLIHSTSSCHLYMSGDYSVLLFRRMYVHSGQVIAVNFQKFSFCIIFSWANLSSTFMYNTLLSACDKNILKFNTMFLQLLSSFTADGCCVSGEGCFIMLSSLE